MQESKSEAHLAKKASGMTLIEVMIVMGILALLISLAVPSYMDYARKANRRDAQQLLMNWANNQEIWRANHRDFAGTDDIPAPDHEVYSFTFSTTNGYTLTATATGSQLEDSEKGTTCSPLTLDQINTKTPADCW